MTAIRPDSLPRPVVALLTGLGILAVAAVDFASGVELRVYPLYYLPLSFAAWYLGRSWTVVAAGLCTVAWMGSNYLAGLTYSVPGVWVFNTAMHGASFLVVGLLLAELKNALAHEKELNRLDPLTALPNARAFHEEARRMLSAGRRKQRPVTIAYIDLDNFKAVNDTHGHHAGDELLVRVAEAIRRCTRITDLSARMGGDEFVLLLPETGPAEARMAFDRLRGFIAHTLAKTPYPVTASIGGVVFVTAPESVEAMVRVADERMYAAKAAGKNRVQLDVVDDPPLAIGHLAQ
jgi:diguanylate cyclase (GGDEF)-like protein